MSEALSMLGDQHRIPVFRGADSVLLLVPLISCLESRFCLTCRSGGAVVPVPQDQAPVIR